MLIEMRQICVCLLVYPTPYRQSWVAQLPLGLVGRRPLWQADCLEALIKHNELRFVYLAVVCAYLDSRLDVAEL